MSVRIEKLSGTAFLSFPDLYEYLVSELRGRFSCDVANAKNDELHAVDPDTLSSHTMRFGDALYVPTLHCATCASDDGASQYNVPYFCRCALVSPFLLHFDSIGDAAGALKKIQRNWAPYAYTLFRRTALIQEKLPYVNLKVRTFPYRVPSSPIGMYVLLDNNTLLASATTTSFLPAGLIQFTENHDDPPSRAYLKLQEALTMMQLFFDVPLPQHDEQCFEAGASPGGWTWLMTQLGCSVIAVDRAPLASSLMKNSLVTFKQHDAFTIPPTEIGMCDWVLSDVICYPERLYEWIQKWLASGLAKNMICTIKMQGAVNWELIDAFAAIGQSRVVHLNYNKHELTWLYCAGLAN